MKNYLVNFFREYNKITAVSYNFKTMKMLKKNLCTLMTLKGLSDICTK